MRGAFVLEGQMSGEPLSGGPSRTAAQRFGSVADARSVRTARFLVCQHNTRGYNLIERRPRSRANRRRIFLAVNRALYWRRQRTETSI